MTNPKTPPETSPKLNHPDLNRPDPAFGWTAYAEQLNGRFAMLGFVALLVLELFTGQDLITWLGLR